MACLVLSCSVLAGSIEFFEEILRVGEFLCSFNQRISAVHATSQVRGHLSERGYGLCVAVDAVVLELLQSSLCPFAIVEDFVGLREFIIGHRDQLLP